MTKIVAISDVHGKWKGLKIPECDILISAGDFSFTGERHMIRDFHKWLDDQPAQNIISVMGNHEKWIESNFQLAKEIALQECPAIHFMEEGLVEVDGLKIWTSAISKFFCNWAYNRYPGQDIQKHWNKIPNCDVVVTHGGCYGILDEVLRFNGQKCEYEVEHTGCPQLLKKVLEIKPKLFVCGHIHEAYGMKVHEGITFVNASICNEYYKPINAPIIINI